MNLAGKFAGKLAGSSTSRFALGVVFALSVSLWAQHARADAFFEDTTPKDYHSPQHFALEFKGGSYSPNIDSTPGLTGTPFSDLFNSQIGSDGTLGGNIGKRPKGQPLFTLEFDWQFWHPFGSFALGVSVGAQSRSTHAFEYAPIDGNGNRPPCTVPNCTRSGDSTTLILVPLTLELIYRFDVLAVRYKVPIVPYIKGGLGYTMWFIQSGDGSFASTLPTKAMPKSQQAYGGTPGWVVHPGVALMLDVLDPSAARTLDAELGINHTYIFAELNYSVIDGLGFKDKMVLSDTTWNAGFAFEF